MLGLSSLQLLMTHLEDTSLAGCAVKLMKWCYFLTVVMLVSFLWVVCIPLLIGVLLELSLVVHFRVGSYQSPATPLHQDWALGLLLLKLWCRYVLMGGASWCESWRLKFERVRREGLHGMDSNRILLEIITPIILPLCLLLAIPYVSVKSSCLYLLESTGIETSLMVRASYGAILACYLFYKGVLFTREFTIHLHNQVRDSKYLMGKTLHNLDVRDSPHPKPRKKTARLSLPVEDGEANSAAAALLAVSSVSADADFSLAAQRRGVDLGDAE